MNRESRPIAIYGGAALAACAACCAPLLLPMLAGTIAAGGVAWTVAGAAGLLLLAVVIAGIALYRPWRAPDGAKTSDRSQACGCQADNASQAGAAGEYSAASPGARSTLSPVPGDLDLRHLRPVISAADGRCAPTCGAAVPDSGTKGG